MNGQAGPTPLDRLRAISPEGARTYMEQLKAIMDSPQLQAVPAKYKLLIGIGVAAALQSSTCTLMWTSPASAGSVNPLSRWGIWWS